ncbi:MAG TPA: aminodeoxychorismate synthase component I [Solirubrobacterales bacterium]|nr:aminodeoxychorismate synthase component I [Solirubrobacterales bacterium]
MRTLLIDNYDSFTFNLFQLLAEVNGREPLVVRNDEAEWEELAASGCDNVVISPGPGHPASAADFGVCAEAIRRSRLPLLGVCLGHQGIGAVHGAEVGAAPEPVHGRVAAVAHFGAPLFAGIPAEFGAVRYHSLCLRRPLPPALAELARSADGVTMAIAHRSLPQWGVQFHPESIAAEHGRRLLENFRDLTATGAGTRATAKNPPLRCSFAPQDTAKAQRRGGGAGARRTSGRDGIGQAAGGGGARLTLSRRRLGRWVDPERAFLALYADSPAAFWLDSSRPGPRARFSFMGDAGGPHGAVVTYDVEAQELTIDRDGSRERRRESVFPYMDRELARLPPPDPDLPFDFTCGLAGYLGYELKSECGAEPAHVSPHPDAALIQPGRLLAFDHEQEEVHLLALRGDVGDPRAESTEADAQAWLAATSTRLLELADGPVQGGPGKGSAEPPRRCSADPVPGPPSTTTLRASRTREQYLADVATCQDHLRAGESYEICLTTTVEADTDADPLALYLRLRRVNPAPFAAFVRFGELAVLSSSPERFLRIDREGGVEARPIKGTRRRDRDPALDAELAADLATSPKDRAENLMIADLMRNDLGSVCEVGSVTVPALMEVESHETVHQLVTTVRGRLRAEVGAVDCVRACFPPGSMTGAPKLRTMEILDELEGSARGVYSGAIGCFGPGGSADLSVAIRTVALADGTARVGAGGAVVVASEPEREYEEMALKAAAALRAIAPGLDAASISLADPRPATV